MSSNISIATVMKNAEMIKLVPDHRKTKKVCKQAHSSKITLSIKTCS